MFKGHQFVKIYNDNWVFDVTEYKGYKVKLGSNGEIQDYREAYRALINNNELTFEKYMVVPIKVLKETVNFIKAYNKEICVEYEYNR